jgi:creatinine amidohydrolase
VKTSYAELGYPEVERLLRSERTPVLLFPLGATEPHGPHGPLATDVLISTGMCERACARLASDPEIRPLVLPPLAFGVTRCAASFAGTIHVSEATLRAILLDVCTSLVEQGLRHVVLVNNHFEPEHVDTIRSAVDELRRRHGDCVAHLDLTRRALAARLTDEFRRGECHAGRYETSLVLADRAELVDRETMATLPYVGVALPAAMAEGAREFTSLGLTRAYCGSPAEASAEEGEATFAALTDLLVELMRQLVGGVARDDPSVRRTHGA